MKKNEDVYWAVSMASFWDVSYAVQGVAINSASRAVNDDVYEVVYWAVERSVYRTMNGEEVGYGAPIIEPPHPALGVFRTLMELVE